MVVETTGTGPAAQPLRLCCHLCHPGDSVSRHVCLTSHCIYSTHMEGDRASLGDKFLRLEEFLVCLAMFLYYNFLNVHVKVTVLYKPNDLFNNQWMKIGVELICIIESLKADEQNAKWAEAWQTQQNNLCPQRRLRSAWTSTRSDQSLHCA